MTVLRRSRCMWLVVLVAFAASAAMWSCQCICAPESEQGELYIPPEIYTIQVDSLYFSPNVTAGDTLVVRFWGFVGPSTCHEFWGFDTYRDSFEIRVEAIGVQWFDRVCGASMEYLWGEPLSVYPLYAGDLTLEVLQPGGAALVETIHVAERGLRGARPN